MSSVSIYQLFSRSYLDSDESSDSSNSSNSLASEMVQEKDEIVEDTSKRDGSIRNNNNKGMEREDSPTIVARTKDHGKILKEKMSANRLGESKGKLCFYL